jgi:predicted porin
MRKSLLAAAVGAAFTLPAYGQLSSSNVQLYGRLNVAVDQYEAKGGANGAFDYQSRMRVSDTASRVGVRGTEDLGGGFRGIFQIETGVNVDTGNTNGQNGINNPNTGTWASRDSWVGIEGDRFGRLTFGRQSAYWANGTIEQIGANYINASSPLASYSQSGVMVGPVARESNTAQYSLRAGGFSATASYGFSTTSFTAGSAYENYQQALALSATPLPTSTPGVTTSQRGVLDKPRDTFGALTLRYNHAMFDLQADWATRWDVGAVPGRDSTGYKVGGAWKYMPGAQISLIWQRLQNDKVFGLGASGPIPLPCEVSNLVPAAAVSPAFAGAGNIGQAFRSMPGGGSVNGCDNLRQDMWVVSWEHTFGNFQALAQYGRAGDVKGSSTAAGLPDSDVQTYLLGGRYLFSKRTWLYLSYNQIKNGRNNYTDYWGGWVTSANQFGQAPGLPSNSSGADPRIIALGFFHQF